MYWILVLLLTAHNGTEIVTQIVSNHDTMSSCFEKRDVIVETLGSPIENYQVICIKQRN